MDSKIKGTLFGGMNRDTCLNFKRVTFAVSLPEANIVRTFLLAVLMVTGGGQRGEVWRSMTPREFYRPIDQRTIDGQFVRTVGGPVTKMTTWPLFQYITFDP